MAAQILTQSEFYTLFELEVKNRDASEKLTDWTDGSILDIITGATSLALAEVSDITAKEFAKTMFATADGPEVTGGPDYLQDLATDHFGDEFARPAATKAEGFLNFSRPTTDAGTVTIPAGTEAATETDSGGEAQRYVTTEAVSMTGLTAQAAAEAVTEGSAGNAQIGEITVLSSTLTDQTVVVTNAAPFSLGDDAENDADYRQTISDKLKALPGATKEALKAAARTVSGVQSVSVFEELRVVIPFNIGTGLPEVGAEWFRVPVATLYVADENGSANAQMISDVSTAVNAARAAGVVVGVVAAEAIEIDWTASISLNPAGPSYATLSVDPQPIIDSMTNYLATLEVGEDFIRADAEQAILDLWGPTGTNDLTAIATSVPVGSVTVTDTQKLVPDVITVE